MAALPSYIREADWRDWYAVNAMELSSHCRARGRYEIALELHDIGTEWYEREVVLKPQPGDTAEDRKKYREVLADYKADRAEFRFLISTRARLLETISKHQDGIDLNKLKGGIQHQGPRHSVRFAINSNAAIGYGNIRMARTSFSFPRCLNYPPTRSSYRPRFRRQRSFEGEPKSRYPYRQLTSRQKPVSERDVLAAFLRFHCCFSSHYRRLFYWFD